MKNLFKLAFLAGSLVFFAPVNAYAEDAAPPQFLSPELAHAQYPEDRWDPMMLQILEDGPLLLDRGITLELAPPPPNSSADTKSELDTVRRYEQYLRSPEQLAHIETENSMHRMYEPFEKAGLFISAGNKPAVDIIDVAHIDLSYFIVKYKKAFNRVRPNTLAPDLNLIFDNPKHASYPSGHATQGYMTALILAALDPAHADQYKAFGFDMGLRREIAGVHYPSDSDIGRKLAQQVLEKLMEVPAFKEQFENAKKGFVPASDEAIAAYRPVDVSLAVESKAGE
ncbi:MAG: phosphatase PAP2 family protein [Alphaproteobacteria bacterium]|nr:phosphatase PAP2 family protein [Alphaproteobacteria bacterium]